MQKLLIVLTVFIFSGIEASIDTLYERFNSENISKKEIQDWIDQFDAEDQPFAENMLEQIEYFTHKRLMGDLKLLHEKLLSKLKLDKFIEDEKKELAFESVYFSKSYAAKSGDLISYFFRCSNMIRAVAFRNLGDLSISKDNADKALVLLDDYVGTGTQFLYETYIKQHHELFNSFAKVYFVVLVASDQAIDRFERIAGEEYESLAQEFNAILDIEDEEAKQAMVMDVKRIPKDQIELVYVHREPGLNDSFHPLLEKYNISRYLGGAFSSFGHTVFFYNCPNNLPEILWNSHAIKRDGSQWIPLFKRVNDVSIYDMSKTIPLEEQVW